MIETVREAKQFGEEQADVIIEAGHLMYNALRGRRIVKMCIKILLKEVKANSKRKKTKEGIFAIKAANVVIRTGDMTSDVSVGRKIIEACVGRLQERIGEIQPKKASPKVMKTRYGEK